MVGVWGEWRRSYWVTDVTTLEDEVRLPCSCVVRIVIVLFSLKEVEEIYVSKDNYDGRNQNSRLLHLEIKQKRKNRNLIKDCNFAKHLTNHESEADINLVNTELKTTSM